MNTGDPSLAENPELQEPNTPAQAVDGLALDPSAVLLLVHLQERVNRLEATVQTLRESHVQPLEKAVEALKETQPSPPLPEPEREARLEERIVEKVNQRLAAAAPAPEPKPSLAQRLLGTDPLAATRRGWLVFDFIRDMRLFLAMFLDRRFNVGWFTRIGTIAILVFVLFSETFLGWFPLIGWILAFFAKILNILLLFFLFKMLSRKMERYRTFLAQRE